MKKKVCYLVIIGLTFAHFSDAQEASETDVQKFRKHEISMDFAPVLSLMNIEMSESGFYFSYKYNKENFKLRAAITSRSRNSFQNQNEFNQLSVTDTSILFTDVWYSRSRDFLHLGIETEKQGRLFDLYGGADLLLGASYESKNTNFREYRLNTEGIYYREMSDDLNPMELNSDFLNVGICPFAGVDLNINDVLSMGIMVPTYFYYSFPIASDEEEMPDGRIVFHENIQFTLTVKL